jgi:hypothetical protein
VKDLVFWLRVDSTKDLVSPLISRPAREILQSLRSFRMTKKVEADSIGTPMGLENQL